MAINKVMVVDDSPTDNHLLTGFLEKNGFQTVSAASGEEAVEMAPAEMPEVPKRIETDRTRVRRILACIMGSLSSCRKRQEESERGCRVRTGQGEMFG